MPRDPQQLIAAGQLASAAALLEERGEHTRAADLYEQLWDHVAVVRAARAAGDLPRALRAALLSREVALIEQLCAEAARAPEQTRLAAASACEERGALLQAGRLHEAAGQPREAASCFERAGFRLDAARLFEAAGDARRAIDLYRAHLADAEAPTSLLTVDDPVFRLGRLLLRCGRAEEALPLLQRVWRQDGHGRSPAGRAVVAALARAGHAGAALHALGHLQAAGEAELTLPACLADAELAPLGASPEASVLAGRYRLGKLLGSGGMGRVYLAVDLVNERQVAVKVFTAPGGARGRDAYRRFLREAQTTGRLQHPHLVSLLDVNEEMGFMVLEYMAGGTLADRLRPSLDLASARSIMQQVAAGLAAAHQRGVIHRDLKPSNIFFTDSGAAKLGDFGVAHLQDSGQTQTGAFVGTVAFMSPEQISGGAITFAADLYALGVTFFLMLTGQLPFSPPDLVGKHLHAPPPAPSSLVPGLPAACDELVLRCLAKRPEDRHESLDALSRALDALPVLDLLPSLAPSVPEARQPEPRRRAADLRYAPESTLFEVPSLQLRAARDSELGRAVVLVRIAPGERRAGILALLTAAAASGDEHLQRVFRVDRELGQAVLETRLGDPLTPPRDRGEALSLVAQLGRALAPLHRAGLTHGAVTAAAISRCCETWILSLLPALERAATGAPLTLDQELAAVLGLAGLPPVPGLADGAALASWAEEELTRLQSREAAARQQALLAEALAGAPAEVLARGRER